MLSYSQVLSLFPETCLLLLKILKNAKETQTILIHSSLEALANSLKGAGKAASDANIKEIYKHAKLHAFGKYPALRVDGLRVYCTDFSIVNGVPLPVYFVSFSYEN